MGMLACPLCCGKHFESRQALKYHLSSLTEDMCCPECCQNFASLDDLVKHLNGSCSEDPLDQPVADVQEAADLILSDVDGTFIKESTCTVVLVEPEPEEYEAEADEAREVTFIPFLEVQPKKEETDNADDIGEAVIDNDLQYYCSSCECNIDSVIDHISTYHPYATVEYEGAELTMQTQPVDGTVLSDIPDESSYIEDHQKETESNFEDDEILKEKQCPNAPGQDTNEPGGEEGNSAKDPQVPIHSVERTNVEDAHQLNRTRVRTKRPPRKYATKIVQDKDGVKTVISHTCMKCSREFPDLPMFKLHRCPLPVSMRKVCPVCKDTFDGGNSFTLHYRNKHDPTYRKDRIRSVPRELVRKLVETPESGVVVKGYSCSKCPREFVDELKAKLHKCKIPPHLHKECPVCFKKYESSRNYTVHMRSHGLGAKHVKSIKAETAGDEEHHEIVADLFTCPKCSQEFNNAKSFQLHKCSVEWECELCNTKLPTKAGLNSHMRMHRPEDEKRAYRLRMKANKDLDSLGENFTCSQCGESLPIGAQEIHEKMHQGDLLFCCPLKSCNKNFLTQELLDDHSQIHSKVSSTITVFDCWYCKQKFGVQEIFLDHVKKHTTVERPYQCDYCGRGFGKPNERIKHQWIHTGYQPHVCSTCGMRFRKAFCLATHERIHTGYRPYTCHVCDKKFRTRSAYTHHSRIHSDLRLFACKLCPKTFKTAVQVANHRNTHTKPFTCNMCNRRFINSYSMRRHMGKHSSYEHICDICGAAYGRSFELRDHLIESHGKVKSPLPPRRPNRKQDANEDYTYDS